METYKVKQALREDMALQKKKYSKTSLSALSLDALKCLEQTTLFQQATCIALYHAISDEVQTKEFIEKWHNHKQILLPIVEENNLRFLPYEGTHKLKPGVFGIQEPCSDDASCWRAQAELFIIPGVAFDRKRNRLGRGKGYYDRLLSSINVPKIGICFDFQLIESVPTEPFDIPMDMVITNNEVL